MSQLLGTLRSWPEVDPARLDELRATPEWELATSWGWIMPNGELSGIARTHAPGPQPRGITHRRD
jgi:hypothetical protein